MGGTVARGAEVLGCGDVRISKLIVVFLLNREDSAPSARALRLRPISSASSWKSGEALTAIARSRERAPYISRHAPAFAGVVFLFSFRSRTPNES